MIVTEELRPKPYALIAAALVAAIIGACAAFYFHSASPNLAPHSMPVSTPARVTHPMVTHPMVTPQIGAPTVNMPPSAHSETNGKVEMAGIQAVARFVTSTIAADVKREVERVTRPGHAAFAVFDDGSRRLAILLVDSPEHYVQLDVGLDAANFSALNSGIYQAPPNPLLRTVSTYRSLAKSAMRYRPSGEDRLIVLLCPESEWAALNLAYINFNPGPLPGEMDTKTQPAF